MNFQQPSPVVSPAEMFAAAAAAANSPQSPSFFLIPTAAQSLLQSSSMMAAAAAAGAGLLPTPPGAQQLLHSPHLVATPNGFVSSAQLAALNPFAAASLAAAAADLQKAKANLGFPLPSK